MANVSPSAIRQSLAVTLAALADWHESRWPYELIAMDPDQYVHKSFAVGVPQTTIEQRDRQRPTIGALATTQAHIRFLYRLRADNLRGDYDLALDAEQTLVAALKANPPTHTHLVLRSCSRTVQEEAGFFVGGLSFDVIHHYALS